MPGRSKKKILVVDDEQDIRNFLSAALTEAGFDVTVAEDGNVAIGIGVEGGKPKIIVNLKQLKAEGQELSADLLKIAKVIQ